jgi:hypothetical protein
MDEQQFEQFEKRPVYTRTASINELLNTKARTLLLGQGIGGETLHVYCDPEAWKLHVLQYITLGQGADERALLVSYTSGQFGGVTRNTEFIPSLCLFPESCDLEFCALLRSYDVALPFTTFDATRRAGAEKFNGYAGYLAAGLPNAVDLAPLMPVNPEDFGDERVLTYLMRAACAQAGVEHAVWDRRFLIAEPEVSNVLAQAETLCASISPAVNMPVAALLSMLCERTLWTSGVNCAGDGSYRVEADGSYVFDIEFDDGGSFRNEVPGAVRYEGEKDGEDVSAMLAMYEGRPYLVAYEWRDWGGIQGKVHVNLFGSPDKFIAELVQRYKLVPDTDT